jgi:histidinol-phosphate aminotransferase
LLIKDSFHRRNDIKLFTTTDTLYVSVVNIFRNDINMKTLEQLVRQNVQKMKAYSAARYESMIENATYLDANENAFELIGSMLNRYPDPYQIKIKARLSAMKGVDSNQIFLGNGSDEAIDLMIRLFCEPKIDSIAIMPPTFGMYEVSAELNDIEVKRIQLGETYDIDIEAFRKADLSNTKMIFICTPNNPTGNIMSRDRIKMVLREFEGIVVLDEAYLDFTEEKSFIDELDHFPNAIVIQTFSKAWGLAGVRLGAAYGNSEIIALMNKIKPPYNINSLAQETVLLALDKETKKDEFLAILKSEKERLEVELPKYFEKVYPSDSNFFLVKSEKSLEIYAELLEKRIVTRKRLNLPYAGNCLRITVGTPEENNLLISALNNLGGCRV